jgi:hypothetical protein
MADVRYPVFESGQTLTKDDLNQVRDFLDGQDRLLGRLIGFGITCGLSGSLSGATLTITTGQGIDQAGRGLVLDTAAAIPVGAAAAATFDFIDPGAGGVTPVLVVEEELEPAPECDETGCEGHAATRVRRARVLLATGRLVTGKADFATEPLLALDPLTVTTGSAVQGAFTGLRKAIIDRLAEAGVVLSAAGKARLTGLDIGAGDLPAVRIYRAAFLNQVFFAVLDLLRCRALSAAPCLREAAQPGIALGWLHTVAGQPAWDCAYRHDYEPPTGLVLALFGGGCDDPSELYRNRLEAILASYQEPAAPAPADPPKDTPTPGDFHICGKAGKVKANRDMYYYPTASNCYKLYVPPKTINPKWKDLYKGVGPDDRRPWLHGGGWTDPVELSVLYDTDLPDFAEAGELSLHPAFGTLGEATKAVLVQVIKDRGVTPDVRVKTQAEAAAITGFTPQTSVSAGDTIVLVTDVAGKTGKVITTGHIPNQQVLKNAGPVVGHAAEVSNAAAGKADTALDKASALEETVLGRFVELDDKVGLIATDAHNALDTANGFRERINGLAVASEQAVQSAGGALKGVDRIDKQLEKLAGFQQETVAWQATHGTVITGLQQTAREVTTLKADVTGVAERVTVTESKHELFQRDVNGALTGLRQVGTRVDDLYKGRALGVAPGIVAGTTQLDASLLDVLRTIRGAVDAGATTRQRSAVRAELARGDDALARLEAQVGTGASLLAEERAALATLIGSLVEATVAAGAPAGQVTALRRSADVLLELLR